MDYKDTKTIPDLNIHRFKQIKNLESMVIVRYLRV